MIKIDWKRFAVDHSWYFGFWYQTFSDGRWRWHWEWNIIKHRRLNRKTRRMIQKLKELNEL
jgi:hypothetical protein